MLYQIRRQEISYDTSFCVHDAQQHIILTSDHALMPYEPLILKDEAGEPYACVLENMAALCDAFDIYKQRDVSASIQKTPFLRECYRIKLMCGATLVTQGHVSLHHYKIRRGAHAVATVDGEDRRYQVSIVPDEDALLLLSSILVIDMIARIN